LQIKQHSPLDDPTVVMNLQFIRLKTELVCVSRWRTMSYLTLP